MLTASLLLNVLLAGLLVWERRAVRNAHETVRTARALVVESRREIEISRAQWAELSQEVQAMRRLLPASHA
jgi:hypothetical protein